MPEAPHFMLNERFKPDHCFWLFAGSVRNNETLADPGGMSDFQAAFTNVDDAIAWFQEELDGGRLQKYKCWGHVVVVKHDSPVYKAAWWSAIKQEWVMVPRPY